MNAPAMAPEIAVQRLVEFYEQLSPASLSALPELYAPQARFKDPFNDVCGVEPIGRVFRHMFDTLDRPRFVVKRCVQQGSECFLTWEFQFNFRRSAQTQTVLGATHLQFDPQGRVLLHRDYWDPAEELYEKIPLLGGLMRWLRRRLQAR